MGMSDSQPRRRPHALGRQHQQARLENQPRLRQSQFNKPNQISFSAKRTTTSGTTPGSEWCLRLGEALRWTNRHVISLSLDSRETCRTSGFTPASVRLDWPTPLTLARLQLAATLSSGKANTRLALPRGESC